MGWKERLERRDRISPNRFWFLRGPSNRHFDPDFNMLSVTKWKELAAISSPLPFIAHPNTISAISNRVSLPSKSTTSSWKFLNVPPLKPFSRDGAESSSRKAVASTGLPICGVACDISPAVWPSAAENQLDSMLVDHDSPAASLLHLTRYDSPSTRFAKRFKYSPAFLSARTSLAHFRGTSPNRSRSLMALVR